MLNLFGFLKVSPPLTKEALEPKIAELKVKLDFYNEEGDKKLKEEEEQVLSGKYDEPEPEEEKHTQYEDRGFRGGRGGRGGFRGGRGGAGRGGARGGRGGAHGGERRKRDDDDDEIYHSSGDEDQRVSVKQAKRPSNKKENLDLDDNNYPTL